jgi:hypothetical protein
VQVIEPRPPPSSPLQVKLAALQGEAAEQGATARELATQLARASKEASAQKLAAASARQQAELLQQQLSASKEGARQLGSGEQLQLRPCPAALLTLQPGRDLALPPPPCLATALHKSHTHLQPAPLPVPPTCSPPPCPPSQKSSS